MNIENEDNFHKIIVIKSFNADTLTIVNLFKDGTIFKLTGADEINFDFYEGGKFLLTFKDRGKIYGEFTKISNSEQILEWNVEGFNRPPEKNTILKISFLQYGEKCNLILEHSLIKFKDAADAKYNAWLEILCEVEKILS